MDCTIIFHQKNTMFEGRACLVIAVVPIVSSPHSNVGGNNKIAITINKCFNNEVDTRKELKYGQTICLSNKQKNLK